MDDMLFKLLKGAITVFAPAVLALAIEYLRRRLGTERLQKIQQELAAKQSLARLAVLFVEQAYRDLDGPEKYAKAAEWLSGRAKEYGIALTPEQIKGLIESAVRTFKDLYGPDWANEGKEAA
ncbi:phage holin [Pelotomaculum propionicicum]|uniref:Uncharacterized protein n=1 Tax=Pelotomaculum propionicicum TaxID=258475 RepID=A0A4Y7RBK9_9FIRM|nr:phage holin [Pelotomaculum propionicicum]TEB06364.1 hypothetical protein Pmgp_03769 [Pelotomaculum propionicicum]